MKKKLILLLIFFIFSSRDAKFCVSTQASEMNMHGFGLGTYSFRTKSDEKDRDLILSEEKLRLDINSYSQTSDANFQAKIDFIHDGTINETKIDLREMYINSTGKNYDIRIGEQVITWGTGDLLFINDIFPKDWNAFYSGQDIGSY
ncbi:hypothetical protein HY745_01250 [Candidatus Desantisbacteria bacterium]|nr:hypothetical protein [Candidatus Desantisbacteria bacterium]